MRGQLSTETQLGDGPVSAPPQDFGTLSDRSSAAPARETLVGCSGSYDPADCRFLVNPVAVDAAAAADPALITSPHSDKVRELIDAELPPSPTYRDLALEVLQAEGQRTAAHVATLARELARSSNGDEIVLVSLMRAGTPVGVLLHRALGELGCRSTHYSMVDCAGTADVLDYIRQRHCPSAVRFVDGWTSKGAAAAQLDGAVQEYAKASGIHFDSGLVVLSDLGGVAKFAASVDDYPIFSSLFRSIGTGLVTRRLPKDARACDSSVYLQFLEKHDLSRFMVDEISSRVSAILRAGDAGPGIVPAADLAARRELSTGFVEYCRRTFGSHYGQIKPGVSEAGRFLLTPSKEMLLLEREGAPTYAHMRFLAAEKGIRIASCPAAIMPYDAAIVLGTR